MSSSFVPFKDFALAFDVARYRAVPDDWTVAVSDVVNSTRAIEQGHYKDVNLAGAATIACVLNACGRDDLPFAFGGDGGIVIVPPEYLTAAKAALRSAQHMSTNVLGLTLRCALVPVSEIRNRGRNLLVASHDLGSGRLLAMFAGGGCEIAESICKSLEGEVLRLPAGEDDPDLTGLSCRWQPLASANGVIVSLVVHARDAASLLPPIYRELYGRIIAITGATYSPARLGAYHTRWTPRAMAREAALTAPRGRLKRALRIMFEGTVSDLSLATGDAYGGFDARAYRASLPRHSDYRKFADSLRMVVDCTSAQADAIDSLLEREWQAGRIDYGMHSAGAALMTCFVREFQEGGHIHFIDGADGGYALAALAMKGRIRANALTKS
ncbi:MAG: DUF3095 domain-containing protein [Alphaproteobacteria bacterium]